MKEKFQLFYNDHLQKFGATAQGVGWKNKEAQWIRFQQLFKLIDDRNSPTTINDLGCGTGDFANFLAEQKMQYSYHGYDLMPEMIEQARIKFKDSTNIIFHNILSAEEMNQADFTLASGIFNIRFNCNDKDWLDHILHTISIMDKKSIRGFAFNLLTKYSDPEFMKDDLFYADPCFLFDHCKKKYSKNVALLHDYDQYDFTILVRKQI